MTDQDKLMLVRRVEHEGSFYLHANDLIEAYRGVRDTSWNKGLCTTAMIMDSLCEMLDSFFEESGITSK